MRALLLPGAMALGLCVVAACGGKKESETAANAAQTAAPAGSSGVKADVPDAAKAAYDKGWEEYKQGNLEAAKQSFVEAANKAPQSAAPRHAIGVILEHQGDNNGAQEKYREALGVQADYEPAIGSYAMSLASTGRLADAEAFLQEKHQRMPRSARVLAFLAEVKSLQKDSGTAQQFAQEALKVDPDNKDAMVTLARDHYRARRIELARYALQAILDGFGTETPPRDKENAEAQLLRGVLEREASRRPAALNAFDAARQKRPDLVEALVNLGVMRLESGNAQEALPLYESAAKFAPKSANVHLGLGDTYRLLGRAAEAKKEFETALQLESNLMGAHYNLGLLYLFAPSVPGMTDSDQAAAAVKSFETFKQMRGPKPPPGTGGEDIDELLNRAKAKQTDVKNRAQAAAAAAAAPPPVANTPGPAGSAAPATSGSAAPASAPPASAPPAASGAAAPAASAPAASSAPASSAAPASSGK